MDADVLIVGAGPAGLSAAITLRAAGIQVIVLDREAQAGGIPRHCGHYPYGLREFRRLMKGPAYAARLVAQARAAGAGIRTATSVTALHPGARLSVTSPDGPGDLSARAVLLATGVRETTRAARLIGGTKPGGVLSTGALQGLVYLDGMRPFRRPVILGSELVAFSAILTCRHLGIRPAAMIEPGPRATARWPAALFPRLLGIPLHLNAQVTQIIGRDRVDGVIVAQAGTSRRIACDGVIVTGGFRPEASLLAGSHLAVDPATGGPQVDQYGRCTDPVFFAAGNLLRGVETAGACWAEGRAVARAMLRALSDGLPENDSTLAATGDALRYVMPQRLAEGPGAALDGLQLRVNAPFRGRALITRGGRTQAHAVTALPERRLTLPLPMGTGPATLRLEAEP